MDKRAYPAREMYQMIEAALGGSLVTGNAVIAAQHVWGYFKDKSSESEKKRFMTSLMKFESGEAKIQSVKNILLMLTRKYQEDYLLNGYYFYI